MNFNSKFSRPQPSMDVAHSHEIQWEIIEYSLEWICFISYQFLYEIMRSRAGTAKSSFLIKVNKNNFENLALDGHWTQFVSNQITKNKNTTSCGYSIFLITFNRKSLEKKAMIAQSSFLITFNRKTLRIQPWMDIADVTSNSMRNHEECNLVYLYLTFLDKLCKKSLGKEQGLLRGYFSSNPITQPQQSSL